MPARLVLASRSPRRRDLLQSWGLEHSCHVVDVDESLDSPDGVTKVAVDLATQKVQASRATLPFDDPCWLLGADTIVAHGEILLGKPTSPDDALTILMSLSGQDVSVVTGVAIVDPQGRVFADAETTTLKMRPYDRAEAQAYVDTGEPMDKAGAFAIQGLGGQLIASRNGSYSNVVGLPRGLVRSLLTASRYPGITPA